MIYSLLYAGRNAFSAVIFSSIRTAVDDGYETMADRMIELAAQQPGFLGVESARQAVGITVSYWTSLEAIRNWRLNAEHTLAQAFGREKWYASFTVRICLVERAYAFEADYLLPNQT